MTESEIRTKPEDQNGNQPAPEKPVEPGETENLLAQRQAEIAARDSRIIDLERKANEKDREITRLKQAESESAASLARLKESLGQAHQAYRALIVQHNPGIPGELIKGESIQDINEALSLGQELVKKVRKGIEEELANSRIPAGAPERAGIVQTALSPTEKIRYGLEH